MYVLMRIAESPASFPFRVETEVYNLTCQLKELSFENEKYVIIVAA
jgi:hypothetical protein